MGAGDELERQENLAGENTDSGEEARAFKEWSDSYRKGNIVDLYLNKSGYDRTQQEAQPDDSQSSKSWKQWFDSDDQSHTTAPVRFKSEEEIKKEQTQAKEIKTRLGVREEEALALKAWLDWYEAGDNPANQIPVEKTSPRRPDVIEKEIKTRVGVREEEAKAVKAWTEFYNAGDFLDAYLEKSGY